LKAQIEEKLSPRRQDAKEEKSELKNPNRKKFGL
jgi:hypothetical protein